MITARLAAALFAVAAVLAVMAALLMPNPPARVQAPAPQPAAVQLAATPAATGAGTGVSAELDADAAFLADLTDGAATDLDPATANSLIATAHRICDSTASRADWLASLTVPGPGALTDGEATKLVDTAQAAFCPEASPWNTPRI